MSVNSSTTTLTFTAPPLPDGMFTGTVVVMVTAVNKYEVGPASNPVAAIIGTYVCSELAVYVCMWVYTVYLRKYSNNLHICKLCTYSYVLKLCNYVY